MGIWGTCGPHTLPIVQQLLLLLDTERCLTLEGIFRISADMLQMQEFKEKIDSIGSKVDFSECNDPHLWAGMLKRYLREMNPPLLTYDLYDSFLEAAAVDDLEERTSMLANCVAKLPPLNHATLAALLPFLKKVMNNERKNMMGINNLATVFGPTLLRARDLKRMNPLAFQQENAVVVQLIHLQDALLAAGRTGALPQPEEEEEAGSAFPGIRRMGKPIYSPAPVLPQGREPEALVLYDYQGSNTAGTLTVAKGTRIKLIGTDYTARWIDCELPDGSAGSMPIAFLQMPGDTPRTRRDLCRDEAKTRANSGTFQSPPLALRKLSYFDAMSPRSATESEMYDASSEDFVIGHGSSSMENSGPKSIREIRERMIKLTDALDKERKAREALERRVAALL